MANAEAAAPRTARGIEAIVRRIDAFQQRHRVPAIAFGVIKKFGDDRGASLCRLRNEGRSATQCARALGTSRGAILGKLFRLGMSVHSPQPRLKNRDNAADDGLDKLR